MTPAPAYTAALVGSGYYNYAPRYWGGGYGRWGAGYWVLGLALKTRTSDLLAHCGRFGTRYRVRALSGGVLNLRPRLRGRFLFMPFLPLPTPATDARLPK